MPERLDQIFSPKNVAGVARTIVDDSLKAGKGDFFLVNSTPESYLVAQVVADLALLRGAQVLLRVISHDVRVNRLANMTPGDSPDLIRQFLDPDLDDARWATKVAYVVANYRPLYNKLDPVIYDLHEKALGPIRAELGKKERVAFNVPTSEEARVENLPFDEYARTILKACDRPWGRVDEVQQILIEEVLNQATDLEFKAGGSGQYWKTSLWMKMTGQTWANSTIGRNIPGSEVFSSPLAETACGRLDIPYPIMLSGRTIPNLTLIFAGGGVVESFTDDPGDQEYIKQILSAEKGSSQVGEIGIGTNPALNRPFSNPSYVEKVGGSFHPGLGGAYTYTEYRGRKVRVDNGVRTTHPHRDITCMMLPKYGGGEILVNGEVIQRDGRFLDSRFSLLSAS